MERDTVGENEHNRNVTLYFLRVHYNDGFLQIYEKEKVTRYNDVVVGCYC